jgi:hypothetical protein
MPLFGGAGTVYDLMGRKIGTLDRLTFNRLISGPYIIVTKSRFGGAVRGVRVMKVPK